MSREYLEAEYGQVLNEEEFNKKYEGKVMIGEDSIMAYSKEGVVRCKLNRASKLYYDIKPVPNRSKK
jgi:hypothetical protein